MSAEELPPEIVEHDEPSINSSSGLVSIPLSALPPGTMVMVTMTFAVTIGQASAAEAKAEIKPEVIKTRHIGGNRINGGER